MRYPSPFFDIGQTYLPPSMKALFRWCRYYYLINPLINSAIHKMAEYPITEIIIDESDATKKRLWEDILGNQLRIRAFQIECGLDFYTYGQCIVTMHFPFDKWLICRGCGRKYRALTTAYRWRNWEYILECDGQNHPTKTGCGFLGPAEVQDYYVKDVRRIRLQRWNPEYVNPHPGFGGAECKYTFEVPLQVRNDLILGTKQTLDTVPDVFIEAMKRSKFIAFNQENIFVLKRPMISQKEEGFGMPLIFPVLKDAYYLQVLRKAQESNANEHIQPLRVLFPQASSQSSDPFSLIDLNAWKSRMEAEIAKWRFDCVAPETWVETRDGIKRAGDVKQGDYLKNHLGEWSELEKTWRRPLREGEKAYEIIARGLHGVSSTVSEGHPFLVRRSINGGNGHKLGAESLFVRAKDLAVSDYIGYPIPKTVTSPKTLDLQELTDRACTDEWCYVDHIEKDVPEAFEYLSKNQAPKDRKTFLEERGWGLNAYKIAQIAIREGRTLRRLPRYIPFDEELAWAVGIYLAEGSTTPKQVLFALHKDERTFIERLNQFFSNRFGCTEGLEPTKSENGIQLMFSSVIAAQVFHSLCPGISLTKRLHPYYKNCGGRIAASLVNGIFDGGGCDHEDGKSNKASWNTASPQLSADVRELLLSAEILPGLSHVKPGRYEINGRTGVTAGSWKLQVNGAEKDRLFAWFAGKPLPEHQGCKIGLFQDGYVWHRIQKVAQTTVEEVIGFQMDKTNASVFLEDDTEAHGTFCLWGQASANTNYLPILPLPIGSQSIGGDGKALDLYQEMEMWGQHIIAGMGIPPTLIFGGMQAGTGNVDIRMLENMFIGYRMDHENMLNNFVIRRIADFMEWPIVSAHMRRFKMADDLQRTAFLAQLNQMGKLSDRTLLQEADQDYDVEKKRREDEIDATVAYNRKNQVAQAEIAVEVQGMQMKAQMEMQQQQMAAQQQQQAQGDAASQAAGVPTDASQMPGGPQDPNQQQPGQDQGQSSGSSGSMDAQQVEPAMPAGATVSKDNMGSTPNSTGMGGQQMQGGMQNDFLGASASPLTMGTKGGAYNILYMARRAATQLLKMEPMAQMQELNRMKATMPQLYSIVLPLVQKEKGSQANPLSAAQSPLPQQRSERRAAHVGL